MKYLPYGGSLAQYGYDPEHLFFEQAPGQVPVPVGTPSAYDSALRTLGNIAAGPPGQGSFGGGGGNTSYTGSPTSPSPSAVGPGPMGHDSMDEGQVSQGLGITLSDLTPSWADVGRSVGQAVGSVGGVPGAIAGGTLGGAAAGAGWGSSFGKAAGSVLGAMVGGIPGAIGGSYLGGKLADAVSGTGKSSTADDSGMTEGEADEDAAREAMNMGLDPDQAIAAMTAARAASATAQPAAPVAPDLSGPLGSRSVDMSPGNIGGYGGSAPEAYGNFPTLQSFMDYISGVAPAPWDGGGTAPPGGLGPTATGPELADYQDSTNANPTSGERGGGDGPTGGPTAGDTLGGGTGDPSGTGAPFAAGGVVSMAEGGFVVPADVVSGLGDGSTKAGYRRLGLGQLLEGPGTGMSDEIPANIDGEAPAAVADGEVYLSPKEVALVGGGRHADGVKRLYALMDEVRKKRHGTTKQPKPLALGDM